MNNYTHLHVHDHFSALDAIGTDETKHDLDKIAEQYMWEEKQPEYGYEVLS